jgi:outer membrane protein assembly factor BamA
MGKPMALITNPASDLQLETGFKPKKSNQFKKVTISIWMVIIINVSEMNAINLKAFLTYSTHSGDHFHIWFNGVWSHANMLNHCLKLKNGFFKTSNHLFLTIKSCFYS